MKPEESERRFFDLVRQGTEALHKGKAAEAVQFLEQAHRLDKENPDAALNLGGAYILTKKFSKAISVLEPLSKRESRNPMVWTNLGAAYLGNPVLAKEKDQQRAIQAFKRALELDPDAPNVAYNLGLIYRDRKEIDQALYWFRRAVQANPNDQDAKYYIQQLSSTPNAEGKQDGRSKT
jgi:tetratricopeptide (TPR) repeat protein